MSAYTEEDIAQFEREADGFEFRTTVGQRVRVRAWGGGTREGVVTGQGFKNNRPLFDFDGPNGEGWWAYEDQLI